MTGVLIPKESIGKVDLLLGQATMLAAARRRIQEARDLLRDELTLNADDIAEVPYETGTDPVLERSQRLFEETFAPSLSPEPHRGRDR